LQCPGQRPLGTLADVGTGISAFEYTPIRQWLKLNDNALGKLPNRSSHRNIIRICKKANTRILQGANSASTLLRQAACSRHWGGINVYYLGTDGWWHSISNILVFQACRQSQN